MKVFTVAQMRAAEKEADAAGLSYAQMMENAGRGVAQAIAAWVARAGGELQGKQVLVLVGPGNNGGDGLVAGRLLAEAGAEVSFYLLRPRDAAEDENFARIEEMGLFHANAQFDQRYRVLRLRLRAADIIVDALLGTGVNRAVGGEMRGLMRVVGGEIGRLGDWRLETGDWGLEIGDWRLETGRLETGRLEIGDWRLETGRLETGRLGEWGGGRALVVGVDCPSGLNCDTGALDALAVAADLTVTFAGPKRGHFIFPGAAAVGELVVVDIGIGPELEAVRSVDVELATARWARATLPQRPLDGHKGTFGKVLIAAGSADYWGAPVLCGRGAYRAGSGLVGLAVPRALRPVAAGQLPEATFPPAPDTDDWSAQGGAFVAAAAADFDALLVGPGLGAGAPAVIEALLQAGEALPPLVVDADGLNALAAMGAQGPARLPAGSVLTPHPGEMARLVGEPVADAGRVALAREWAARWGQVVLLKGAFTVAAAPDGRCLIAPFANPLLGSAGSGDVLAGVVVSLRGQGLEAFEAAALGAYLHGAAGALARQELGDAGLLSRELADWVARARGEVGG